MPDGLSSRPGEICGKIGYPSKAAAIAVRRMLRSRHARIVGGLLEPYHCEACGVWHLGRRFTEKAVKRMPPKGRARERGRHWVPEADLLNEAS